MPSTTSAVTRRSRWCATYVLHPARRPHSDGCAGSLDPPYDEHVGRRDERVEPDVVVLAPCPGVAGQLVVNFVGLPRLEAEGGHVDMQGRLAHCMWVEVD